MTWNQLAQFIADNLTPILAAMTIISFIGNVIQYKTKKFTTHFFGGIYHACGRSHYQIKHSNLDDDTKMYMITVLEIIQDQAVAGLRASGKRIKYKSGYDRGTGYKQLRGIYVTLLQVRRKWPNLKTGKDAKVEIYPTQNEPEMTSENI